MPAGRIDAAGFRRLNDDEDVMMNDVMIEPAGVPV